MEIPGSFDDVIMWIGRSIAILIMVVFILPKQHFQFRQANGAKPTKRILYLLGISITAGMVVPLFAQCGFFSLALAGEVNTFLTWLPVAFILLGLYYFDKR
jgi:hypothetical protein